MARWIKGLVLLAVVAGGIGLYLTRSKHVDEADFTGLSGDAAAGETLFIAGGCASCHHAPDAKGDAKMVLAGGQGFASPFGTFHAPNISTDPEAGIGAWSLTDFASALRHGTAPDGSHYYPAFPYTAYTHLENQQIADLWAFFQTLPADGTASQPHDVGFPFNIRRSLGGWKLLYLRDDWVMADAATPELERGRELVEALAHCGECHTPRDPLGGLKLSEWLGGAPNPAGRGTIPDLRPGALDWATGDIAYYLETGFTPDYDSAGGHMVAVIENFAKLPAEDRQAVAAYLKALPVQ